MKDNDKCTCCHKRLYLSMKDEDSRKEITRVCDACWDKGLPTFQIPDIKRDRKVSKRRNTKERQNRYCNMTGHGAHCQDAKCIQCLFDTCFVVARGKYTDMAQKMRFEEWEIIKK